MIAMWDQLVTISLCLQVQLTFVAEVTFEARGAEAADEWCAEGKATARLFPH